MTRPAVASTRSGKDGAAVIRAVTVIMGIVVGLTFMFGFGNVLNLALHLGVPIWVAPLVAPAVDLSILGLLLGIRHLALHGAVAEHLRPARRLIFASLATLGPEHRRPDRRRGLRQTGRAAVSDESGPALVGAAPKSEMGKIGPVGMPADRRLEERRLPAAAIPEELVERARQVDAAHRAVHQRPISAETLRKQLRIGAGRSRSLVALVRAEARAHTTTGVDDAAQAA